MIKKFKEHINTHIKNESIFKIYYNLILISGETTTVNLNASWKVVYSELGPILMESIITVFKDVLNNVTKSVTYKDIFLP